MFYKGGKMVEASPNTDLHGYGEAIRRELRRRIPRGKRLRVLDVGTGFGINAAFLSRWLAKGSEVWTVDPSKEVLAEVQARFGKSGWVNFVNASADDLGFQDGHFDAVVSVMVLHHIEELRPALEEMARVLRPGGVMLIVDYKPEASHRLEFRSLHEEQDFFTPDAVVAGLGEVGRVAKATDFGLWFLVEVPGARISARPSAARAGRARPRAAG